MGGAVKWEGGGSNSSFSPTKRKLGKNSNHAEGLEAQKVLMLNNALSILLAYHRLLS